ncbi:MULTISPECIES: type II toxin-antitoxin system Phd/YefM family antitoxin [Chryseobacterium]|uniref:Antitoxin n=2 Tax=Chryseobacterium TaxID=59732 RepID=A0A6N4XD95_9FLAO|nr:MULTISPECIES: type II toxin-antitoxin system Phd/YefM family antitoxin [Chryseobacterium]CAA7197434.1 hypothetical protein CHRY9293_03493 [Chryseobacterium potabilaquae]CAA7392188.1 hypothetical protein CHRY9393_03056 [Chryseobacterium fistulae]
MKTVTVSAFRKDIKKYVELAKDEQVLVNRGSGDAFYIVPAEKIREGYSKEFIEGIKKAEKQIKEGKTVQVKSKAGLETILKHL